MRIHNIAVAGHSTCGKTTMIEELLYLSKATPRAGSVDNGTSILDHAADEKERKYTIDATPAYLTEEGDKFTFIDTPGYPDFLGNVMDAYAAVEMALICVDAVSGVRVNTRRTFHEAGKAGLARAFLITRMDADLADFDKCVAGIKEAFGKRCVPLFLPNASGPEFASVESTYNLAEDCSVRAKKMRRSVVENIVESDEKLMERYLAEEHITDDEINHAFTDAMVRGLIVPILCCSAQKEVGFHKTMKVLLDIAPAHDEGVERPLLDSKGEPIEEVALGTADDPLIARVFKVELDPFVGKMSYVRILSGSLSPNQNIYNSTKSEKERVSTVLQVQGKDNTQMEKAMPGDIVAMPKIDSASIGDTLCDPTHVVVLPAIEHTEPMVKLAIEPVSRNDEAKIGEALARLSESDSYFKATRNAATHELVIAGRSSLHLDTVLGRLDRIYNLHVEHHIPKTSYKESIKGNAEAQHKHKKQSGGRGQYGEVYIKLEHTDDGELEFENKIVGGAIPGQFIPAVEKGIRESMEQGILAGFPISGCHVTLYDGSFHNVDSSEQAFKTAGREAFKKAFMGAKPCLLEPLVNIEVHMPVKYMGDITSDLNGRRARISGMDADGDHSQVIMATVPEAEVKTYSTELRSLTHGEGSYSISFSHYEAAPAHVQKSVIKELEKEATEKH